MTKEIMWRPVIGNPNAIEVNLGAEPKRGFPAKDIAWRWGKQEGWVLVEWKRDSLWVDGVKQECHRERPPKHELLCSYKLRRRIEKRAERQIHLNVMDAAIESGILHGQFAARREGKLLLAWGVGFGGTNYAAEYVRCFSWYDGTFGGVAGWRKGMMELNGSYSFGNSFYQNTFAIRSCI